MLRPIRENDRLQIDKCGQYLLEYIKLLIIFKVDLQHATLNVPQLLEGTQRLEDPVSKIT